MALDFFFRCVPLFSIGVSSGGTLATPFFVAVRFTIPCADDASFSRADIPSHGPLRIRERVGWFLQRVHALPPGNCPPEHVGRQPMRGVPRGLLFGELCRNDLLSLPRWTSFGRDAFILLDARADKPSDETTTSVPELQRHCKLNNRRWAAGWGRRATQGIDRTRRRIYSPRNRPLLCHRAA